MSSQPSVLKDFTPGQIARMFLLSRGTAVSKDKKNKFGIPKHKKLGDFERDAIGRTFTDVVERARTARAKDVDKKKKRELDEKMNFFRQDISVSPLFVPKLGNKKKRSKRK